MPRPSVLMVLRERGVRGLGAAVWRQICRGEQHAEAPDVNVPDLSRKNHGVDVLGFFTAEHGVGEAARSLVTTLNVAGINSSSINYTDTESRTNHPFRTDDESHHRVLICSINAEQMTASRNRLPENFYKNRYTIGQWFWELEESPSWYEPAWPMVDELWAPTCFIEEMLQKSAPSKVRVTHVPSPVVQPSVVPSWNRSSLGIDDRFMFLFVFDMMSVMKRKNPLGLIEAYSQAFRSYGNTQLVIKTMNGSKRPDDLDALMDAANKRSDVIVIDSYLTRVETSSLISSADCYVSLHRSEGLGLTLSEAMSHGVPVIATDYSGPTDFMTAENSYLVSWDRVPVGEGAGGYSPTATWAEPRIDDAVVAMREVFTDREAAKERGLRGQREILSAFSPEASAAIMRERLEEIWSQTGG